MLWMTTVVGRFEDLRLALYQRNSLALPIIIAMPSPQFSAS